jgi:hypothetical protein
MYPMNGQGQQNPSTMSLYFHGTSVTPSLSSTAAAPYPSQLCLEQPIYYSFEPDQSRLSYDAVEVYHRSHVNPFLQNNTRDGVLEAQPIGLARFQQIPKSVQVSCTQKGRTFQSPQYSEKFLGAQEGHVSYSSPPFDHFGSPLPCTDSNLSFVPSEMCNGDETYVTKRFGLDLYPNANSKRLFTQKYFQNNLEQGQMTISTPFQVQSPPKLNSSIPPELAFDWDHSDFDPQVGQDLPFSRGNDGQYSNPGIEKFQQKRRPSTVKRFDCSFLQENNTVPDFEVSFHKMGNEGSDKEFGREQPVPDDVHLMEIPFCQFHGSQTIEVRDNAGRELLNKKQEIHDSYPSVRRRKPQAFTQQIRFFNEGIEVDFDNRPLPRLNSLDSMASSIESLGSSQRKPKESDDDVDLAGNTSMWGNFKL